MRSREGAGCEGRSWCCPALAQLGLACPHPEDSAVILQCGVTWRIREDEARDKVVPITEGR